ncbi:ABC transporter permease [Nakamurella sp. PAMC28650]|uniref:ABC transporter permease n=1 Tax=Nakamurella sp. PAMC28650 TaxID=2762325 RepID=UPI00164ED8EB|nr:ABC transporter permease [Nakamurella sp. PAMC28650]QNK79247.1 ABC transporter permease [Nakamurella sp. PAMC28650]
MSVEDKAVQVRTKAARSRRPELKLTIGCIIVGFFLLIAVLGPLFTGDPQNQTNDLLAAPSSAHWLGTTQTGQDVFTQMMVATRSSLLVGLIVGVTATILSVLVGVVGGFLGGKWDEALSLFSNVVLVIPGLPLLIMITAYLKNSGEVVIGLIIAITSWAASSRVLRAQTLSLRSRDYVNASRTIGERTPRTIGVEILPNLLPIIASQFVFAVILGILSEAGLSYLGLGNINSITWGTMLYFAQNGQALTVGAWWWFVPPGLAIALFGCGLSLINFSIDEVINPQLKVAGRMKRRKSNR